MTAKEARVLAETSGIDRILSDIEKLAKSGHTQISYLKLTETQVEKLQELGYEVYVPQPSLVTGTIMTSYSVSW